MSKVAIVFLITGVMDMMQAARVQVLNEARGSVSKADELCSDEMINLALNSVNGQKEEDVGQAPEDDWMNSLLIQELYQASDKAMSTFWEEVGLSTKDPVGLGYWIEAKDLCIGLVKYLSDVAVLPPANNVACYPVGEEVFCDLAVTGEVLQAAGPNQTQDLPDFHDAEVMGHVNSQTGGSVLAALQAAEGTSYSVFELASNLAGLFRIFPCEKPVPASSLAETAAVARPFDVTRTQHQKHAKQLKLSEVYMNTVIGAFNGFRTEVQMAKWFGRAAFNDQGTRREILRVLNSVKHMISNVEPVYEGPQCSPNTYAYVYPRAYECRSAHELKTNACTKYNGKFVFYLCSLYFRRENEMIETLVHEGSHHATAYTDDVDYDADTKCYGRDLCKRIAVSRPSQALKNADNFCYYIQDVATQVGPTTTQPAVVTPRPTYPAVATPRPTYYWENTPRPTYYTPRPTYPVWNPTPRPTYYQPVRPMSLGCPAGSYQYVDGFEATYGKTCKCNRGTFCYRASSQYSGCPRWSGSSSSFFSMGRCSDCYCRAR
jgi:hypothetical protein